VRPLGAGYLGSLRHRIQPVNIVNIRQFMQEYKNAWEQQDTQFANLLPLMANTTIRPLPFSAAMRSCWYWRRVKLQEDVQVTCEVLATSPTGGIAHWHVTYQWPRKSSSRSGPSQLERIRSRARPATRCRA
jgi:hypothetical protein